MSGTLQEYHGGRKKVQGINLNTGFAVSLRRVLKRTNRFSLFPPGIFIFRCSSMGLQGAGGYQFYRIKAGLHVIPIKSQRYMRRIHVARRCLPSFIDLFLDDCKFLAELTFTFCLVYLAIPFMKGWKNVRHQLLALRCSFFDICTLDFQFV